MQEGKEEFVNLDLGCDKGFDTFVPKPIWSKVRKSEVDIFTQ